MAIQRSKADKNLLAIGDNVKIMDINKLMQQSGVLVDVHVKKLTSSVTINPKTLGVDVDSSMELQDFFKKYVNSGKISFLTKELSKQLTTVETSIRQKKKKMAIDEEGRYMPIAVYKEFKEEFLKHQERFNNIVHDIAEQWDELMEMFKQDLDFALSTMNAIDKKDRKREILSKIPSREQFEYGSCMDLELSAFPIAENISILDEQLTDDMKESIRKKSLNTVYQLLGDLVSDIFPIANNVVAYFQENSFIHAKQSTALADLKKRVVNRNILNHPVMNYVVKVLDEIGKLTDDEEIEEKCEEIMILIYKFAKEIDIDVYLNLSDCVMKESDLEILASTYDFNEI